MSTIDGQNCALCGSSANLLCQRCFESYCSMNCQRTDWPQHKVMCIPMPRLISKQSVKMINKKPVINLSCSEIDNEIPEVFNSSLQSYSQNQLFKEHVDNMRRPRVQVNEKVIDQSQNPSNGINTNCAVGVTINDDLLTQIDKIDIKSIDNTKTANLVKNMNVDDINQDRFRNKNNLNNIIKWDINDRLNKFRQAQFVKNESSVKDRPKLMNNPGFDKEYGIIHNNNTDTTLSIPNIAEKTINKSTNQQNDNNPIGSKPIENSNFRSIKPWKIPFPITSGDKSIFKAIVQFVDPNAKLIWLTEKSLESHAVKLLTQINANIKIANNATVNDIYIDNLLAAPFEDYYYRAIVLKNINSNNEVHVRLVDYGNDFSVHINNLKLPIPIMKNLNAYAFCCRYDKPSKIDDILNIRIIGKESDEIFTIEEIDETTVLQRESILKVIPNSFEITIMNIFNDKSKAFAVFSDKNMKIELDKLNDILISEETFQYDFTTKPKNGDIIAARTKEWKRGIIIDQYNNKYLIFFIDFGEIEIIEQIKILPKSFLKIPLQTVLIDINRISIDEESFNTQYFSNLKKIQVKKTGKLTTELTVDCDLYDNDNKKLCEITLNHFSGDLRNIQYLNTWNIPLLNNDIVRITNIIDYSNVYITRNSVDIYSKIFNEIGNLDTIQNQTNPKINEIVLTSKNNQYERCLVLEKIDSTTFHVQNIDTGFEYNINLDKIKISNNFVKFCPIYTIKCSLDVSNALKNPGDLLSNKVVQVLDKYYKTQQEFILKIDHNNIVELFFNESNNSMNKELIAILNEITNSTNDSDLIKRKPENDDKLYHFNDIEVIPITTGKNVKILILDNSSLKHGIVTSSVCNLEFLDNYYSEYQPKIHEYCSSNTTEYSPKENELCLTIYDADGQWYRAVCLKNMPNNEFKLLFLDFGNTEIVNISNIRKFQKDFLFPCIANICRIDGLPPKLTDEQFNKLTPILHANGAITVDEIQYVNDIYLIRIDGVKQLLEVN